MQKSLYILLLLFSTSVSRAQKIPQWNIVNVVNYFSKDNDTTYIINFWSTWCKPCLEEIPYMQKIVNKYKDQKIKFLMVSLDTKKVYGQNLTKVIKARKITAPVVWLNETDADVYCPKIDSSWGGALPATLFINNKANYKKFFEGQMSENEFEKEIQLSIFSVAKKLHTRRNLQLYTFTEPLENASYVIYENIGLGDRMPTSTFQSKENKIFSLGDGKVVNISLIDSGVYAIIIRKNNLYYCYSNFKSLSVDSGQTITSNQLLGFAEKGILDNNFFSVDLLLTTEKGDIELSQENFIKRKKAEK